MIEVVASAISRTTKTRGPRARGACPSFDHHAVQDLEDLSSHVYGTIEQKMLVLQRIYRQGWLSAA